MFYTSYQEYGAMYLLRFSNPKKSYFKYMDFSTTYHIGWYQKRLIISREMQTKDNVVQSIPFVDENRGDDVLSCLGTAVHASGTSQSLPSPFVPASANCGHDRKNTTIENRQTQGEKQAKQCMRQNIPLFRKEMISLLTDLGQIACFGW